MEFLNLVREIIHEMPVISTVGLVLIFGFLGSRIAQRLKLPAVTGYIFAGVIVGHSVLGLVEKEILLSLRGITTLALGLIAFTIGSELKIRKIRELGKNILYIAPLESLGAFFFVSLMVLIFGLHFPSLCGLNPEGTLLGVLPLALLLGAIASATAPAATLAIMNEYRAKGPLTDTLLAVVALNDGFCIIIFGMVYGIMNGLAGGGGQLSPLLVLGRPLLEILGSIILGALLALISLFFLRLVRGRSGALIVMLGMVMVCSGMATMYHLSSLLANMALGFTLANVSKKIHLVAGSIQGIEPPIYVAFFTIAGMHLDLHLLLKVGLLGGIYFISRIVGKIGGAGIGARLAQASRSVQKYLGLGLIPQAGVAIGLILLVQENPNFSEISTIITNVVLAGVALNELFGPLAAKMAITKSGEAFKR